MIFDEAHDVEDVAGQYFGVSVSSYQFENWRATSPRWRDRKEFGSAELDKILMMLGDRAAHFFAFVRSERRPHRFSRARSVPGTERRSLSRRFIRAGAGVAATGTAERSRPEEADSAGRRGRGRSPGGWNSGWNRGDRRYVYWIERRGRGTFLQATPIDVSQLLDEKLFDTVDTVVLTSATLAVAGEFEFTKERLGLRNARTLVVPSHFDYEQAGVAVRSADRFPIRAARLSPRPPRARSSSC